MGYNKTHALIQCRWNDPVPLASKETIKAHLEKAEMEYASFNHTSHLLSITTKVHDPAKIFTTIHTQLHPATPSHTQPHTATPSHTQPHLATLSHTKPKFTQP